MANTLCSNGDVLKGLATPARNKYFYGKLMDAFHFDLEQKYGNRKRWLLSRLGLGHGVLCGLQVAPATDGKQMVVGPGVAIDALGREIIVPAASQAINPRQPTDACGRPSGDPLKDGDIVHICLAYHECEAEPVPVLAGDCDARSGCAASLIQERYRILVRKGAPPDITPRCGFESLFASPPDVLYAKLVDRISQPCGEAQSDPCVVLAQIKLPEGDGAITDDMIDLTFRPLIYSNELLFELLFCLSQRTAASGPTPTAPTKLTHITEVSWPHDGKLKFGKFMDGGLKATFSRNVTALAQRGEAWFIVTVEYPIVKGEQLALLSGTVFVQRVLAKKIDISGNQALFQPDGAFTKAFDTIINEVAKDISPLCRVVLKCDALIDEKEQAVDGNFLGGHFPSGNGVPGGTFESWFTLVRG